MISGEMTTATTTAGSRRELLDCVVESETEFAEFLRRF